MQGENALFITYAKQADGGHPHGRAITPAAIGFWVVVVDPYLELLAVPGIMVFPAKALQGLGERFVVGQCMGNGYGHHRVIGVLRPGLKEREIFCL